MNPIISVAQMGVTEFWKSLRALEVYAKAEKQQLERIKLRLQAAYSATRKDPNATRARANQALLQPLIHTNSQLRLQYRSLTLKFNQAVSAASDSLKKAGITTPTLSGLGEVATATIVVGVVAVSILGSAWAIAYGLHERRVSHGATVAAALRVFEDPNATTDERKEALKAMGRPDSTAAGVSDMLGLGGLLPIAALLAVAFVVPAVLKHMPRAGRAAA